MKKKGFALILVPILVALACLMLPETPNRNAQKYLAEKLLLLKNWQRSQSQKRLLKTGEAEALSPSSSFQLAGVIFRTENSYNSSLWIDKGSEDAIQKNSPVLSGDSLVGVVDYVGKRASAVRLITDSGLTPAVRVARGTKDPALARALNQIAYTLENSPNLIESDEERKALLYLLSKLSSDQATIGDPLYLAKGILQGSGSHLMLKGIGFNYDYRDQHGPARDLRTNDPPLVQVGDLLVTSGMDGLFPEGLKVAYVQAISPLSEGAFAYQLQARPAASDIHDLDYVTILAPQGFDQSQIPTRLERVLQQLDSKN
jgi:cell shape-determining protein MreC